jgi:hypothetical protein
MEVSALEGLGVAGGEAWPRQRHDSRCAFFSAPRRSMYSHQFSRNSRSFRAARHSEGAFSEKFQKSDGPPSGLLGRRVGPSGDRRRSPGRFLDGARLGIGRSGGPTALADENRARDVSAAIYTKAPATPHIEQCRNVRASDAVFGTAVGADYPVSAYWLARFALAGGGTTFGHGRDALPTIGRGGAARLRPRTDPCPSNSRASAPSFVSHHP